MFIEEVLGGVAPESVEHDAPHDHSTRGDLEDVRGVADCFDGVRVRAAEIFWTALHLRREGSCSLGARFVSGVVAVGDREDLGSRTVMPLILSRFDICCGR